MTTYCRECGSSMFIDEAGNPTKVDVFDWIVEIRIADHTFSSYFPTQERKDACLVDLDLAGYRARVFFRKQLIQDW